MAQKDDKTISYKEEVGFILFFRICVYLNYLYCFIYLFLFLFFFHIKLEKIKNSIKERAEELVATEFPRKAVEVHKLIQVSG